MPAAAPTSTPIPQAAAICFRPVSRARADVLLITSRSGEWAIPKGRIDPGFTAPQAAANEALEEAGVRGRVIEDSVGSFEYTKKGGWATRPGVRCHVQVFPLLVDDLLEDWLESDFRQRRWVPASKAASEVEQPGLTRILHDFPAWLNSLRT